MSKILQETLVDLLEKLGGGEALEEARRQLHNELIQKLSESLVDMLNGLPEKVFPKQSHRLRILITAVDHVLLSLGHTIHDTNGTDAAQEFASYISEMLQEWSLKFQDTLNHHIDECQIKRKDAEQ